MKVGYVCTSNAKPRGEVRAPPAEKRTTAAVQAGVLGRAATLALVQAVRPRLSQGRISRHVRLGPGASKNVFVSAARHSVHPPSPAGFGCTSAPGGWWQLGTESHKRLLTARQGSIERVNAFAPDRFHEVL